MLIAGVVCLAWPFWSAARAVDADPSARHRPHRQVMRAVAPTQLAAAVMLAAGGVAALAAPASIGLMVLVFCVIGAIGTVGRRFLAGRALRRPPGGDVGGLRGQLHELHPRSCQ